MKYRVYALVSIPVDIEAENEHAAKLAVMSMKFVGLKDYCGGEAPSPLKIGNIIEWDEPVVEPEPVQPKQVRTIKHPPTPNPFPQGEWVNLGGMYDMHVWHLGDYTMKVHRLPGVVNRYIFRYRIEKMQDVVSKRMIVLANPVVPHPDYPQLDTLELAQAAAESHLFLIDGVQDDLVRPFAQAGPEEDCQVCAGEGYWEEEGRMVMCQVCRGKGYKA